MKEGSLFVLFCMALFHGRLDLQCNTSWILNDFFTKNKIKLYPKISEELECAFGAVGKILMSRI
jgi:hypothetical protein